MTTTYRVLITCDELRSAWCAGMLELSGPYQPGHRRGRLLPA